MRRNQPNRIIRRRQLQVELLEDRRMLAGPYAPAAGQEGSTAISADAAGIAAWATAVSDYSPGADVDAQFQAPGRALGPANGASGHVVPLGRGGSITLVFEEPIWDGIGPDFAVFENAFIDSFLELGYVEVSSDGVNFFRFGNDSLTAAEVDAFGAVDPTEIHNLAGKYRVGFGTPFDLEELAGTSPQLNVNAVTHVRIVDVVGDGSDADSNGDPIFDPYPTVQSAGFDLDAVAVLHSAERSGDVVGFEDVGATLPTSSSFSGPDPNGTTITGQFDDSVVVGSFQSGGLAFNNSYSIDFGSWTQWAYSNENNVTSSGFANQFSSFAGGGAGGSAAFGVAFAGQGVAPPTIERDSDDPRRFESLMVTNTTYAALSMKNGDAFAKKFGGTSGNDADFLRLIIEGKDANDNSVGEVDFYLADYRFSNNSLDYIVDDWVEIDVSSLAVAQSLELRFESSDVGPFGINTPTYVAVDDIVLSSPSLLIDIADSQVSEADGDLATHVRVGRPDDNASASISVNVASVDPKVADLPSTVRIASGERFVEFPVAVTDNDLVDGDKQVTVQVSAAEFATASGELTIVDDDVLRLILTSNANAIAEGDSAEVTVRRNTADLSQRLVVDLESSEPDRLSHDQSVFISAGRESVTFTVTAVDDDVDQPSVQANLTASARNYSGAETGFRLTDNDTPSLSIELLRSTHSEAEAAPKSTLEEVGSRLVLEASYSGADDAGGFESNGLQFNNQYDPTFRSWSGWSYSNVTDTTTAGFANQFSAIAGGGAAESATYAVATAFPGALVPTITRDPLASSSFQSLEITNTTYAALSMQQGDLFAKKFGGESGDDPDYFLLTINGLDEAGNSLGTVDFYLADYRFADNSLDYIVDHWTTIDLSPIGEAVQLSFVLESSDVGIFGMNTPAYFAVDNVQRRSLLPKPKLSVLRNVADVSEELQVQLVSSDSSEVSINQFAVIPAGKGEVLLPFTVLDDLVDDGDQVVALTARAENYASASTDVLVQDDDAAQLALAVSDITLDEALGVGHGVVRRNSADLTESLVVELSATPNDEINIPDSITIPAGLGFAEWSYSAIDNEDVDGDRTLPIRVSATGYGPDEITVAIKDDDIAPPTLQLQLDRTRLSEADSPDTVLLEDIGATLAEQTFYNGADLAGEFTSGPVRFNNTYDPAFGSWGGWAASNVTDNTTAGFLNQYSVIAGKGAYGSPSYAVASAFPGGTIPTITLIDPQQGDGFDSLMVNNSTYAGLSMANGDAFAKRFGGESGEDPDFFMLTIEGHGADGQSVGTINFYLADFRFADSSNDYIVDEWTRIDVSSLVGATSLQFSLDSSDVGAFGMNTPAYFAVDQIVLAGQEPVVATATVTRNDQDLSESLTVQLSVDDETEAEFPRSVMIPSGEESATFEIRAIDDGVADGEQQVVFTAGSDAHASASSSITIDDDDHAALTLSLPDNVISESNASTQLVVHRNSGDNTLPLSVRITATDQNVVIPQVEIPAGKATTVVEIGYTDNTVRDGDREIRIDATANGFDATGTILTVMDDEVAGFIIRESGESTAVVEAHRPDEIEVLLSAMPLSDVVINANYPANELIVDVARITFTPNEWDTPQAISIHALPDFLIEDDELHSIVLRVDDQASDSLFGDALDVAVDVMVEDYQPTDLRITESGDSVSLVDEVSGASFVTNELDDGIQVETNERSQTITLEQLSQTDDLVQVNVSGGDDIVIVRGSHFTSLNGGEGYDKLVVELPQVPGVVEFLGNRAVDFEEIVVRGDWTSDLVVDAQAIESLSVTEGPLLIQLLYLRDVDVSGEGTLMAPIMIEGEFAQVVQTGDTRFEIVTATPWQNVLSRWDVNQSGDVTAGDALEVINRLTQFAGAELPDLGSLDDFPGSFFDVNGDGNITTLDALQVLNEVARRLLRVEAEVVRRDTALTTSVVGRNERRLESEVVNDGDKVASFSEPHGLAIRQLYLLNDEEDGARTADSPLETSLTDRSIQLWR